MIIGSHSAILTAIFSWFAGHRGRGSTRMAKCVTGSLLVSHLYNRDYGRIRLPIMSAALHSGKHHGQYPIYG